MDEAKLPDRGTTAVTTSIASSSAWKRTDRVCSAIAAEVFDVRTAAPMLLLLLAPNCSRFRTKTYTMCLYFRTICRFDTFTPAPGLKISQSVVEK
jgi:hypothetical protein